MQTVGLNNQLGRVVQNVQGRFAADGELQIKVPSAFLNHYKANDKYKNAITSDDWYATNLIGKVELNQISISGQKTTEVPNSNTENLIGTSIKMMIEGKCHYISSSIIIGADGEFPVAIILPNNQMEHPQYNISPLDGCFCPKDMNELNKCLTGCLNDANCSIGQKFSKMKAFYIVDINS